MRKLAKWFKGGSTPKALDQPDLPEGPVDILAPAVVADPYPLYARLRDARPVAELASGGVLLTRHADIQAALGMSQLGNAPSRMSALAPRNRAKYPAADVAAHIPPFLDMPEHKLPRTTVSRAFFTTFRTHGPRIDATAHDMLDAQHGQIELIRDLSSPFALRVMANFIGLTAEPAQLKRLSHAFFHLFAPITDPEVFQATNAQLTQARAVFHDALTQARAAPDDTFLSAMITLQADQPELTDAMIVDNALLVFADGIENIEAGAASVFHRLAQADVPRDAPVDRLVSEALRLNTPAQIIPRIAHDPVTLHSTSLAPGQPVFLALGSGNVDPDAIEDPLTFRPDRDTAGLSFGLGRHRCIGEPLGLAMLSALITALLNRGAQVTDPERALDYVPRFGHRWPQALPVRLD